MKSFQTHLRSRYISVSASEKIQILCLIFKTFFQVIRCPVSMDSQPSASQTNPIALPSTSLVTPSQSFFFFFWFLLLTLEGPRAQSLDVFSIITHILGELIQSIGSSDSQIYIFHSNLSAELQTYIHNCLFPISHWTSNRQFKLTCPKLKPQFLPTPSHKHPAPTRPPVLS